MPATNVAVVGGNLLVADAGVAQNDNITLVRNFSFLRVTDPGNTLVAGAGTVPVNANTVDVPLANITGNVQVDTLTGTDRLIIDFSQGTFGVDVDFDGGAAGADSIRILGGSFVTGRYTADLGGFGGTITYNNAPTPQVTFSNVESGVDDLSTTSTYTLDASLGNSDSITVANGAVINATQTQIVSEAASNFQALSFANKARVIINAQDGIDTVNVNATLDAVGLVNLDVFGHNSDDTGDDAASDVVNFNDTIAGNSYSANGGDGNDAFLVSTTGNLSRTPGAITVRGEDGDDSVTVNDQLTLGAVNYTITDTTVTRVLAGFGGLTYDDTVENVRLDTGPDDNVVTATSLAANTNYFVNGNGANDTLILDFSLVNPPLNATVTYNGGTDTLATLGDSLQILGGVFQTHTYTMTTTDATGHAGMIELDIDAAGGGASPFVINFAGIEPILNTGQARDVIFNLPVDADNAVLEDDGVLGNSRVRLRSTDVVTTFEQTAFVNPRELLVINGGAGNDTFGITNAADFSASLTINGQGDTDIISTTTPLVLGSATALGNLSFTAETINIGANISTDGAGNRAGSATFNGAVLLGGNTIIDTDSTSLTDGAITFSGSIDSNVNFSQRTLTLNAGAGVVTIGAVGQAGNRHLGGLTINTTALLDLTGNIRTDRDVSGTPNGNIDLSGATGGVRLSSSIVLDTDANLGGDGGNLFLNGSAVNAAATATQGLTIRTASGNATLAALGTTTPLAYVEFINPGLVPTGQVRLLGDITTDNVGGLGDGHVDFGAAIGGVRLDNSVTINTDANANGTGGNIDLFANASSNVNALNAGTQGLSLRTGSGTVDLSQVGNTTPLGFLTYLNPSLVATGLVTFNGNITTDATPGSGAVNFNAATGGIQLNTTVTVSTDGNLDGAGGALSLNTAINAAAATAQSLRLRAGSGNVSLGTIGGTTPLGQVRFLSATGTTGVTTLNGNITTDEGGANGDIDFASATGGVTLAADITLDSDANNDGSSGLINLGVAVNAQSPGAQGLILSSGDGNGTDAVILVPSARRRRSSSSRSTTAASASPAPASGAASPRTTTSAPAR